MYRKLSLCLCLVLYTAVTTVAQDAETKKEQDAKEMSGMSIVGNDEAPKLSLIHISEPTRRRLESRSPGDC